MSRAGTPAHTPAGPPRKMHLSAALPHILDDIIEKYENIGRLVNLQVKALEVIIFVSFFYITFALVYKV